MRPENFFARVGDFYRGLRFARGDGGDDFDGNHFALAAEAAADQRLDDADLRHLHFEDDAELVLEIVGNLRGRPDGEAALPAGLRIEFESGESGMRLHRGVRYFVGDVAAFDDFVGFGEAFIGIAEDVVIVLFDIVRALLVNEIGFRGHGIFGIEPGGQRFVFDVDQFQGFFGDGFGFGYDAGDVVADVADFIHGESGFIVADGKNAVLIRGVHAGDDCYDAGKREGAAGVDFLDARVGIRRMQNFADHHSGNAEIVGVLSLAGGFSGGINQRDGFSDDGEFAHFAAAAPFFSASMAALMA